MGLWLIWLYVTLTHKSNSISNGGAEEARFDSFGRRSDGAHNGMSFVGISNIFATQMYFTVPHNIQQSLLECCAGLSTIVDGVFPGREESSGLTKVYN